MAGIVDHGDHVHVTGRSVAMGGDADAWRDDVGTGGTVAPASSVWTYGSTAGRAALITSVVGLGLVAGHAASLPIPSCPLRSMTGIPCPFCGLTHCARLVVRGDLGVIAGHDPAALALTVLLAVAVITQLVAIVRRRTGPAFMSSRVLGVVVLVVLAAHWATTIVTGGLVAI